MRNQNPYRLLRSLGCLVLAAFAIFLTACEIEGSMDWPGYTIAFHPNGGSGTMARAEIRHGDTWTLSANAFYREGHTFLGWATAPDGDVELGDRASVTNLTRTAGAVVTLHAVWRAHVFRIAYDANGAEGAMGFSIFTFDEDAYLRPMGFEHPNDEMLFVGWARSRYGYVEFENGGSVKNLTAVDGDEITLYARWGRGIFIVTFDINGGMGTTPAPHHVVDGAATTLPGGGGFSNPGYIFVGWNTAANGSGENLGAGSAYIPDGHITLYAEWVSVIHVPGATLAAQLAWLQTNARTNGNYLVEIARDENISPHTLSFGGRSGVVITLAADSPRTIGLSTNGSLFTVGSGVTLALGDNITLNGRPVNNAPLVRVGNGGTLAMSAGSVITGNANNSAANAGGGVRVDGGGAFSMNGGEISGNSVVGGSSDGGGVYVAVGGTFDMRGGAIFGNSSGRDGGGVFNAGAFRMSGGTVYGSDAAGWRGNAAGGGAALFNTSAATAHRGTFNPAGVFSSLGAMGTANYTLHVVNGQLSLSGTVSIIGSAQMGQTLTANTAALGGSGDISFQWRRGFVYVGHDSPVYTVQAADVGYAITVTVTRAGNFGSVTSAPVGPVTAAPDFPPLSGSVVITGTAQAGQMLVANTNALGGSGEISFQWIRGSVPIPGTNISAYIVRDEDVGSMITVAVTRAGNSSSVVSPAVGPVIAADAPGLPALTGTVSITGTAQVGQTLTADTEALGGSGAISFQWMRESVPIPGTNISAYIVRDEDVGSMITVAVTRAGNSSSVVSPAVGPVIAADAPGLPALTGTVSITGTAQVGQTLTADTTGLSGTGEISFQWMRGTTAVGTNSNTYTVQAADLGFAITVIVTRIGNYGSVIGGPTSPVINHQETLTISFADFTDVGANVTEATISILGGPAELRLTVLDPGQYDPGSIRWFLGITEIPGDSLYVDGDYGETLIFGEALHGERIGIHTVTVEVEKDGMLYGKVFTITVAP